MPKKKSRGIKAHQTEQYRMMFEASENKLCKSQLHSEIYDKLMIDGRLERFIAVIQFCSIKGYDIKTTVDTIIKSFPSYIDEKDFNVEVFKSMMKTYHNIAVAWGYGKLGDEISNIIVKNKALSIVERTDNMDDIVKYQSLFGNKEDNTSNDNKTTVNFNLFKK